MDWSHNGTSVIESTFYYQDKPHLVGNYSFNIANNILLRNSVCLWVICNLSLIFVVLKIMTDNSHKWVERLHSNIQ